MTAVKRRIICTCLFIYLIAGFFWVMRIKPSFEMAFLKMNIPANELKVMTNGTPNISMIFMHGFVPWVNIIDKPDDKNKDDNKTSEPPIENKKEITKENTKKEAQISSHLSLKNETTYNVDVESMLAEKPNLSFSDASMPQILIVHTHTSESYASDRSYELTDTDRCQDTSFNMVRVGEELKTELEKAGINVIHDKTIHDYPSYTSSYKRCGETIEQYLQKYPSIQAVFDIHRDAIIENDGTRVRLCANINGEDVAQVMIVCGTDLNNLWFDTWEDNLRFAMKIQNYMETKYPGLMRPLNLRKERFNLHLTHGSLIFEVGTSGNSLKEAVSSMKYISDGIAYVCHSLQ